VLTAGAALRGRALKGLSPRSNAMPLRDRLKHHEADIVTIAGVPKTGISEPDDEQHGHSPSSRARATPRPRMIGKG
jgi:hypothetical protein